MASIAKMMHPEELRRFQEMMGPLVDVAFTDAEGRELFALFADSADPSKTRQLGAQEFMATFFTWFEKIQPLVVEALANSSFEPIGHVKEGEVAHVVTRSRMKIQEIEIEEMTVISTKDYQGEAMLMLSGEIKQMAEALKRSLAPPGGTQ